MRPAICLTAIAMLVADTPCSAITLPADPVRPVAGTPDPRAHIGLLSLGSVAADPVRDAADAALILQRLQRLYLEDEAPSRSEISVWLAALSPDGSWQEFDYRTVYPQFFPPYAHLQRVSGMALAYRKDPQLQDDAALLDGIRRAITFWTKADPQTRHLWFVEIGAPMLLAKALVLMQPELDDGIIRDAFPLLTRALNGGDYVYNGTPATGANLTWIARAAFEAAILAGDVPLAQQAAARLAEEIRVTADEGIQADYGYYQHGKQFYAGGYGASFTHDCATLVALLDGTRYAIDPVRVGLLVDYMLEGPRWMGRNGYWVAGARGREISRPGGRMSATAVHRLLQAASMPRRDELAGFAEALAAAPGARLSTVTGNRHFWSADLMVQHAPGWSAFIDLTSKRTFGTEGGNNENLLGYHLVDGIVQVMRDGAEYHNIAPLWDWKKLPGATILQYPGDPPFIDWWGDATRGTTAFTGGLSDGERGMAVLDFDRSGLRARKVWSVTDRWVLAAVTGLAAAPGNTDAIATTIDQRHRRGAVLIESADGNSREAEDGDTTLQGPVWVRHDGTGYFIPDGLRAVLRLDRRSEPWKRVNMSESASAMTAQSDLLTLWIDHGSGTVADFHYIIWPDLPAHAPLPAAGDLPRLRFLDGGLVVVDDAAGAFVQAAAFSAGRWSLDHGEVAVSAPCLFQVQRAAPGAVLTVADPAALRASVAIGFPQDWLPQSLRGYYTGPQTVALPKGAEAGNSVRVGMSVAAYVRGAAAHAARTRQHLPLVEVPEGVFTMGSADGDSDERPVREVRVSGFQISQTEVTMDLYRKVREWALDNGYEIDSPGHPLEGLGPASYPGSRPVVRVSWFSAALWCNAFSEMNGLEPPYYTDTAHREVYRRGAVHLGPANIKQGVTGYRLTTETEWEYACSRGDPMLPSMTDQVAEWCFDYYGGYPGTAQIDPAGPDAGFERVRRGAVKGGRPGGAQTPSLRLADVPSARGGDTGFRVVTSLRQQ